MKPPDGLSVASYLVCKLKKQLYGLKQASRQWFSRLHIELTHQGFLQSKNDYSLFIKRTPTSITIAAVYVDDIILTGDDIGTIQKLKGHLHQVFSIKDLGTLHYFLGLEVSYVPEGVILSQRKFASDLIKESGFVPTKKVATPLPVHLKLQASYSPLYNNPTHFRSLVGKLNYLTHTRPDVSYAVQSLSQYMQNLTEEHHSALLQAINYVAHTLSQGILIQGSDTLHLHAYSDSDWGACIDTRRSVTGYVLLFGNSPISWRSNKQSSVSKSSSEAEYRALAAAASEITWIVHLL